MTTLEIVKKSFKLQKFEYDVFNQQALSEPHEVRYIAGYKFFFGGPIYASRAFYNHVFHWTTEDGRRFSIMLEPHIQQEGNCYPTEIEKETLDELIACIRKTVDKNFVADEYISPNGV